MKTKILINRTCTCGIVHEHVPEKHRIMNEGDVFDGIWFECSSCHTTIWVKTCDIKLFDTKEAA